MVIADQQTSELTEPCIGSFNDPSALVASQLFGRAGIRFLLLFRYGESVRCPASSISRAQGIEVIAALGDYPLWFLPRPAFGSRDADFVQRGVRKRTSRRRGTFQPNSQRNALTALKVPSTLCLCQAWFCQPRRHVKTSLHAEFIC
jgi:hypothetical protein